MMQAMGAKPHLKKPSLLAYARGGAIENAMLSVKKHIPGSKGLTNGQRSQLVQLAVASDAKAAAGKGGGGGAAAGGGGQAQVM
jgi:hypothetical protein